MIERFVDWCSDNSEYFIVGIIIGLMIGLVVIGAIACEGDSECLNKLAQSIN